MDLPAELGRAIVEVLIGDEYLADLPIEDGLGGGIYGG